MARAESATFETSTLASATKAFSRLIAFLTVLLIGVLGAAQKSALPAGIGVAEARGLVGIYGAATATSIVPGRITDRDFALAGLSDALGSQAINTVTAGDAVFAPVGNALGTHGAVNLLYNDRFSDQREFAFSLGANASHGGAGNPGYQWDKATLYLGMESLLGSRNTWALNALNALESGMVLNYANTIESDMNNDLDHDIGSAIGTAGLAAPSAYNITINGQSPTGHTITAGLGIISSSTSRSVRVPLYERGVMCAYDAVRQACFDDYSSATASLRDLGRHLYSIDLNGATDRIGAIRLPSGSSIVARNAANTVDLPLLKSDERDQVTVGSGAGGNIVLSNTVVPDTEGTRQLGSTTRPWAKTTTDMIVVSTSATPASSKAPCTKGTIEWDSNFVYVCVETNSWKRSVLANW